MPTAQPRFLVAVCDSVAPSGLIGQTILSEGAVYDTIMPAEGYASWPPLSYPGVPASPGGYAGLVVLGGRMRQEKGRRCRNTFAAMVPTL